MNARNNGAAIALTVLTILSLARGHGLQAQTPPATATPALVSVPTPTNPGSPLAPMTVVGQTFVDARPSGDRVRAFIGATECGATGQQVGTDAGLGFYLAVSAAGEKPGCGTPGVTVHFQIGDRSATQTLPWRAGVVRTSAGGVENVVLVAGPAFARYSGSYRLASLSGWVVVEPLINGVVCGVSLIPTFGEGPTYDYEVVVDPAELTPGCGTPGATVSFRFADGEQRVPIADAIGTGVWQPGIFRTVNLAFPSTSLATLPPAGQGTDGHSEGLLMEVLGLALAVAGSALTVSSVRSRLRKRGD